MIEKLKQRWEVKSNLQLVLILLVFSLSGSATLFARSFIFGWINYSPEWPFYLKVLMYLVVVVPVYQLALLTTGALVGQFEFFWRFEKKTMRRLGIRFGK